MIGFKDRHELIIRTPVRDDSVDIRQLRKMIIGDHAELGMIGHKIDLLALGNDMGLHITL